MGWLLDDLQSRPESEHWDFPLAYSSDGNRVMLFVCPECGDLGCGAITAALDLTEDIVIWSDFRHENSYDELMTTRFPGIGPFYFDAGAYRRLLKGIA